MKTGLRKIPIYVILVVLAFLWLLPIVSTLLVSFKNPQDFVSQKFYQLPTRVFLPQNFTKVMTTYRLGAHFVNSLLYAAAGTAVVAAAAADAPGPGTSTAGEVVISSKSATSCRTPSS